MRIRKLATDSVLLAVLLAGCTHGPSHNSKLDISKESAGPNDNAKANEPEFEFYTVLPTDCDFAPAKEVERTETSSTDVEWVIQSIPYEPDCKESVPSPPCKSVRRYAVLQDGEQIPVEEADAKELDYDFYTDRCEGNPPAQ